MATSCPGRTFPLPAVGVRIPDIVIPPVLKAFKSLSTVGAFMLSYHRETGTEETVRSSGNPLRGHTGTTITEYISKALEYSREYSHPACIEADHVSVTASPEVAIKRIAAGGHSLEPISRNEADASLSYVEAELREASKAGGLDIVTIDTCDLIDHRVDHMEPGDVEAIYEERVGEDARALESVYGGGKFRVLSGGRLIELKLGREELVRLAAKYWLSLEYAERVYRLASEVLGKPFLLEVAFDETPRPTEPVELAFYLSELARRGVYPDYIAPNIGFEKREDYRGRLEDLRETLSKLSAIAWSMGSMLSIHSGSGHNPYSDKGPLVWETVREATGGLVKYKVSGVYIQLLLEVMSRFPKGSKPRRLYEEIYDYVLKTVERYVKERSGLYSKGLEEMVRRYREASRPYDPRADFFRHYFFLFQAAVDADGRRWLREEVLQLYLSDWELRREYEREAYMLTERLVKKLGLEGNLSFVTGG